jgi:ketosteroid isomerase-like protein
MTRDEILDHQIALIREAAEAYNGGGVAAVEAYFDDAIELREAGMFIEAATYRGKAAVVKYFRRVDAAFEDIQLVPLEFIERPPAVVVPLRLSAHAGKLRMIVTTAFWIHDRKIRRMQTFRSREAALRHAYGESPIVG